MTVKTRFAPSPTGYLHVGGARTALFSYLYARRHQGKFLLRIEDTDRERSTQESVQAIFEGMQWLGLASDETPIYQTSRFDRYEEVIQQFLAEGNAYRCYCSKERLETLRESQIEAKQKAQYDGHCRDLQNEDTNQPHVIRFKNPQEGVVEFEDCVHGKITVANKELDDLIIARTDGTPTYNFTVVVDDSDMGITHVIRGDDHVSNTPRQINMLKALEAAIPLYAHVPMILGEDGKRLSKRHGAVSVVQYRDDGYLPEALLNYLVRLGWSHGDEEVFSLPQMIELFDLKNVNKAPASFNTDKLQWLNQHYMKTLEESYVAKALSLQYKLLKVSTEDGPGLVDVVKALRERAKTLKEMAEMSRFWFEEVAGYDEKALAKFMTIEAKPVFELMIQKLEAIDAWEQESLHDIVKSVVEELGVKFPKVAQPMRIALTGNTVSPSIDVTLSLFTKAEALKRIKVALNTL